jgi:ATP-dependent Clp protease ATP-binding subunit ClpA
MKLPAYALSALAVLSTSIAFVPSPHYHRTLQVSPKQLAPTTTTSSTPIRRASSLIAFSTNPNAGQAATESDQDDPLQKFGIDLTERAAEGRLDPVIGMFMLLSCYFIQIIMHEILTIHRI